MFRLAALLSLLALAACVPSVYDAPYPVAPVELPRDEAAHPAPIEWWYWVGHLTAEDGRAFGFQLTFFKAYAPPAIRIFGIPSNLLFEKGHVAHAALTDLAAESFAMEQRADFLGYRAAASSDALDVSVGAWRAAWGDDGVAHELAFDVGGRRLDLVLTPAKPAALHGDPPGIQSMGEGGVSYYLSHTRMAVRGSFRDGPFAPRVAVTGSAWHDHQWGDFRVDALTGWDWFALQLDDGRDVMLYLLRGPDGGYAEGAGSIVTPDGRVIALTEGDFALVPIDTWTSASTGAVYPSGWRLLLPEAGLDVTVRPLVREQEMDTRRTTTIVYWEGAVEVVGSHPGRGYVELTNYDRAPFDTVAWRPSHDPQGWLAAP